MDKYFEMLSEEFGKKATLEKKENDKKYSENYLQFDFI